MIYRVTAAVLGAIVVTAGLLLAMETVTSVFRERDGTRYFRITDILRAPDPARPERPPPAGRLPDAPEPPAAPAESLSTGGGIAAPAGIDPALIPRRTLGPPVTERPQGSTRRDPEPDGE